MGRAITLANHTQTQAQNKRRGEVDVAKPGGVGDTHGMEITYTRNGNYRLLIQDWLATLWTEHPSLVLLF